MTHTFVLLLAVLIGVVAGLRSLTAPAVVAWAALAQWINMTGTWAWWLAQPLVVAALTVMAVIEFAVDLWPELPDRTSALPFVTRLMTGAFAGAVLGTAWGYPWSALGGGIVGAVAGTLGGYRLRRRLAAANDGHDLPVALLEDAVAVLGGFGVAALAAVL